jgi:hypothetical protein
VFAFCVFFQVLTRIPRFFLPSGLFPTMGAEESSIKKRIWIAGREYAVLKEDTKLDGLTPATPRKRRYL